MSCTGRQGAHALQGPVELEWWVCSFLEIKLGVYSIASPSRACHGNIMISYLFPLQAHCLLIAVYHQVLHISRNALILAGSSVSMASRAPHASRVSLN